MKLVSISVTLAATWCPRYFPAAPFLAQELMWRLATSTRTQLEHLSLAGFDVLSGEVLDEAVVSGCER